MTTKQRVKLEAEKLSVEIEITKDGLELLAPKGKIFVANDCHSYVSTKWDDEKMSSVWRDLQNALGYGTIDCTDESCDWC